MNHQHKVNEFGILFWHSLLGIIALLITGIVIGLGIAWGLGL